MDKTIVKRTRASQVFEWIVGLATAAAIILIVFLAMDRQLDADAVLLSSAAIVVSALGGLLLYVVAAVVGGTTEY